MTFLLQQGWGMLKLDLELIQQRFAGGVIMSPRVYTPAQLERHASDVRKTGGRVLFDPQFYQPHTEREALLRFPYWDGLDFSTRTFGLAEARRFCERVLEYQGRTLNVSECIVPGRYTNAVSDDWLQTHRMFADAAANMQLGVRMYSTVALGPDVIADRDALYSVLDEVSDYPVDGIYLVFLPPDGRFFVRDDSLLYNLLDSLLTVRLQGKDIIVGYANQQSLVFAAAGVTQIASGNFRNTRCFNPQIFNEQDESPVQRAQWYYHPSSLSEFTVAALHLAFRRGLGPLFGPPCAYCNDLVTARDPGTVRWSETQAFKHYLFEFARQWDALTSDPRGRTVVDKVRELLDSSASVIETLRARAFVLGDRAFDQCLSCTRGAVEAFAADRAEDLQRLWGET